MANKKKRRCNKKREYNSYNKNSNESYEMSETDVRTLGLLELQILMIWITIYGYIIFYISTIQGIQSIYDKYNNIDMSKDLLAADETALQAVYILFATQLIFTNIAISRYNILYEEKKNGEIDYSLDPNISVVISNILSTISRIYLVNGAEGSYERDSGQTIFGV